MPIKPTVWSNALPERSFMSITALRVPMGNSTLLSVVSVCPVLLDWYQMQTKLVVSHVLQGRKRTLTIVLPVPMENSTLSMEVLVLPALRTKFQPQIKPTAVSVVQEQK